jgi:hypothetical protein
MDRIDYLLAALAALALAVIACATHALCVALAAV